MLVYTGIVKIMCSDIVQATRDFALGDRGRRAWSRPDLARISHQLLAKGRPSWDN
jgi:hypothetical protein